MSELKKEFKSYMNDLESHIQNKQDLEYVRGRTTEFMNFIMERMEYILKYKEAKISQIEKIQNDLEEKISSMQQEIDEIEEDIYMEDMNLDEEDDSNYDFEIVCPYCDNEFLIDLDKNSSEVECPECNNIIELEWTGKIEEQGISPNDKCESGHCSQCPGCRNIKNQDEDDDM